MELDALQLLILGTIASVLVQGYRWLVERKGEQVSRAVLTIVLVAVSLVLSYIFFTPVLPSPGGNPLEFVQSILSVALGVVGSAIVLYNWLYKAIFDKIASNVRNLLKWSDGK